MWPAFSFDHLVGAAEQRQWHAEAACLCGFEVYEQLDFRRLLNWQVGRLVALEYPSGIYAGLPVSGRKARAIADQAAGRGVFTDPIDRWNGVVCRQRHDLLAPAVEERFSGDDE